MYKIVVFAGLLTLIFDFCASIGLPGHLAQFVFQLLSALSLFILIMCWMKKIFLKPPVFKKSNCEKYKNEFVNVFESGNEENMNVVVQEMSFSLAQIIDIAMDYDVKGARTFTAEQECVFYMFARMGTEHFCRIAARNGFGEHLLSFMIDKKKCNIGLENFAQNFLTECLKCDESFVFRETDPRNGSLVFWQSSLKKIYGNEKLLCCLRDLINPDCSLIRVWNRRQVHAYIVILNIAFDTCYGKRPIEFSFLKAFNALESTASRCCLNEKNDRESFEIYDEIVLFYGSVIKKILPQKQLFLSKKHYSEQFPQKDFLDCFVDSVVRVLSYAVCCRRHRQNNIHDRFLHCLEYIFPNEKLQNDCVAFYEKLKKAVSLKVSQNNLEGIYVLFLILENYGFENSKECNNNTYLSEIHMILVDYARKYLLESYKLLSKNYAFVMPEYLSIDLKNKTLIRWSPKNAEKIETMSLY